ncbi:hypothetical protein [Rhodoblastus acidophilus]|uniref:hypothetical protein n=1 Tax=Rhodoblastus acidophilus TaxID=1074 RepID=UPI002224D8E2|nr:hypothetical protein [Rhodoblastus acidophilus]
MLRIIPNHETISKEIRVAIVIPAIHAALQREASQDFPLHLGVDARQKAGHDVRVGI